MISVENVSFGYTKNNIILNDVSFSAGRGEIINILGPNGCGKSTLIKLILGFLPIKKGSVTINGDNIKKISRKEMASRLSYVPQLHSGTFSYSVIDVVLMGRLTKSPWYRYTEKDYEKAYAALERLKLTDYADRQYLHLSGGERQLVLIARSLVQNTAYFVMDEPVSGLDYGNQFMLLQTIKELSEEGLSFLITTHHPEHALFLGGRALLIKGGRIIEDGEPEKVITTGSVGRLYNMPHDVVEKFSHIHF